MLSKINRYGIVLAVLVFTAWFAWDIGGAGDTVAAGCLGAAQIDHCAGYGFTRPISPCEAAKIHFEQAIHYVGQSHVVTTIDGVPSNDPHDNYYTRGYSGPTTAAERSAESEAMKSWKTLNCTGPINPNSEFWV